MHSPYSRSHPFLATITDRFLLTKPGSTKTIYHLTLDIRGSGIAYKTGDSIGVYPLNDPEVVTQILSSLSLTGDEPITTKTGEKLSFHDFLSSKANVHMCGPSLFQTLVAHMPDSVRRASLQSLTQPENQEALKCYLDERHLLDLLQELHPRIEAQQLTERLMPLLPRFYSIASSMVAVGEEMHLTVVLTEYETNDRQRFGVASHYLGILAPLHRAAIPIYLQPSKDFTLPENDAASLIMVGPGTGVAPFRGFLQERMIRGASGQNWLFFGERCRATDFLYQDYWEEVQQRGKLRLDVAFSRDQAHKIYVQHQLLEHGAEIYKWLQEGAYFYVCGDAEQMAKAVDQALLQIFQQHGGEQHAADAVKLLRKEKRYLRDVY